MKAIFVGAPWPVIGAVVVGEESSNPTAPESLK